MDNVDRSFLGVGWGFPPTFRREFYGVEMLVEEDDVRSSLYIILNTLTGERVMLPTFGCNLLPHVFGQITPATLALIEKIIKEAIAFHEPRVIVENLVSTAFHDRGVVETNIEYSIITTNTRYNLVFPFYIREATNVEF